MRTKPNTLLKKIHDGPGFLMSVVIFISHWAFLPCAFFGLVIASSPSDLLEEVRFPGMDLLLPGAIVSMIFVTLTKLSMNRHGLSKSRIIDLGVAPLTFVTLLGTVLVVYPAGFLLFLYIAIAGPANISIELWLGVGIVIYLYWYVSDPVKPSQEGKKNDQYNTYLTREDLDELERKISEGSNPPPALTEAFNKSREQFGDTGKTS